LQRHAVKGLLQWLPIAYRESLLPGPESKLYSIEELRFIICSFEQLTSNFALLFNGYCSFVEVYSVNYFYA